MKKTMKLAAVCMLAGGVAGGVLAAEKIVVDGSTTVGPIAKAFAEFYMKAHPDVNITVSESGSGNAVKSLMNGACQVGTMSRAMKADEMDAAKAKGRNPVQHTIAMDGLTAIVHPSNPVQKLSKEDLKAIYMGEIANWKKLGGPDAKIVVIGRDTNSGTYESFQTLVMKSERVTEKAEVLGSNGAIRQRVLSTPAAIGYVGLAFTEGVKPLPINDVAPTPETVADKTYPIARALYMYTDGEPKEGTPLCDYVMMFKTDDGRKIIAEQGFVPLAK